MQYLLFLFGLITLAERSLMVTAVQDYAVLLEDAEHRTAAAETASSPDGINGLAVAVHCHDALLPFKLALVAFWKRSLAFLKLDNMRGFLPHGNHLGWKRRHGFKYIVNLGVWKQFVAGIYPVVDGNETDPADAACLKKEGEFSGTADRIAEPGNDKFVTPMKTAYKFSESWTEPFIFLFFCHNVAAAIVLHPLTVRFKSAVVFKLLDISNFCHNDSIDGGVVMYECKDIVYFHKSYSNKTKKVETGRYKFRVK